MNCQKLIIVLTMLISFFLTLGLWLQQADAGACRKMGLSNKCVKRSDIDRNAVTTSSVKNNTLKASDLSDEAGADYSSGDQLLGLTAEDQIVRSVTITAPRSGVVIVNASGYFIFNAGSYKTARCFITTGSVLDFSHVLAASAEGWRSVPFGATRGFTVDRGSATFNLVCDEADDGVSVLDTSMTAIYVPTRY